jgi:glycosyltransferase
MKVSIVTVVYNNHSSIVDCIQSVLLQTYPNIEHIVIDGGSTDGTQQLIEPFKEKLAYYISEKDSGIFDAYNKGIKKATGDIVGILNSDDFFYGTKTIQQVVEAFKKSHADLVYAKGIFVSETDIKKVKRIYPSRTFKKEFLFFGWIPLHPTIFVRREIYQEYGLYDKGYSIASDYDISLRWFKNNKIKKYFLDAWVVQMRLGGKSTTMKMQKRKSTEDLDIIKRHNLLGFFTLFCKIGRKIPQYLVPQIMGFRPLS